jgi:hypothetical protein
MPTPCRNASLASPLPRVSRVFPSPSYRTSWYAPRLSADRCLTSAWLSASGPQTDVLANGHRHGKDGHRGRCDRETLVGWAGSSVALSRGSRFPTYLAALGFDLATLHDLYGEREATLEDFIAVATGEADFELLNQRRQFEKGTKERNLSREKRETVLMVCDFKRANPDLTVEQLLCSQWLDHTGGIPRIRSLFGSVQSYWQLGRRLRSYWLGSPSLIKEVRPDESHARF